MLNGYEEDDGVTPFSIYPEAQIGLLRMESWWSLVDLCRVVVALNFNPALGREAEAGSSLKSSRPTWSTGVVPGQSGTQRNPVLKTQKKKKPSKKSL